MPEDLVSLIVSLDEKNAVDLVRVMVNAGKDPLKILDQVRIAMAKVGDKFGKKEFFLPDLIMSGEILRQIAEILEPKLKASAEVERLGKVVLGTVFGGIHDIGKDVLKFIMDVNGFDFINLGVDVSKEKFVEAINLFIFLSSSFFESTLTCIGILLLPQKIIFMFGGVGLFA